MTRFPSFDPAGPFEQTVTIDPPFGQFRRLLSVDGPHDPETVGWSAGVRLFRREGETDPPRRLFLTTEESPRVYVVNGAYLGGTRLFPRQWDAVTLRPPGSRLLAGRYVGARTDHGRRDAHLVVAGHEQFGVTP